MTTVQIALVVVAAVAAAIGGWLMVSRFARVLGESEAMAATLEDRVREKERDLEHTYARIAELERARFLADERERIQREMHDGIGGRLVSALAVIDGSGGEAGAVSGMLRRAIGDLRLVVDAVGSEPRELTAVLGSLRERLETELRAVGVELEWRVEDAPSSLGPAQSLHVTRIIEEAFANVVRHAGATKVVLSTSMGGEGEAIVEIADDGRGIQPGAPPGRGLANMWRRATEIGARLELGSAGKGTTIRLRLPRGPSPESGMTGET